MRHTPARPRAKAAIAAAVAIWAALVAVAPGPALARRPRPPAAAPDDGRLVVAIVVDQLRLADLVTLRREFGPRGFAGLGEPRPMRYVTIGTETATSHATLATGAWAEV